MKKSRRVLTAALFLLALLTFLFLNAMTNPFTHDEHQFVSAGLLIAKRGLLPYVDFPHHHMPYLAFLYALAFKASDAAMLVARGISSFAAWAMSAFMLWIIYRHATNRRSLKKFWVGIGLTLLLLANPVFIQTSGKAWNHDLPALLMAGALLLFLRAWDRPVLVVGSGLLMGLAVGFRLAYLPAMLPFTIAAAYQFRLQAASALKGAVRFALGMIFGIAPLVYLILLEPTGFIFGNWTYQRLNTAYRTLVQHPRAMDLLGKFAYLGKLLVREPMNLIIPIVFLAGVILFWRNRSRLANHEVIGTGLACSLPVFLLVGSLAPTPSWPQYFHAPVVAAALALAVIYSNFSSMVLMRLSRSVRYAIIAAFFLGTVQIARNFPDQPWEVNNWIPVESRRVSMILSEMIDSGKVLTLAPSFPLEGGVDTYEQFATGPFSWRVSQFLLDSQWQGYSVISPTSLARVLENDPPQGILIGFELESEGFVAYQPGGLEIPLRDYAIARGYTPVRIDTRLIEAEITLWVR